MSDWYKDTRSDRRQEARSLSHEEMLHDFVARLDRHRAGRIACEIHLSLLRPYHQRPNHLRMVHKSLEPLIRKFDAGTFELHNNNIVVVAKGATIAEIDSCVLQIRYLFSEDPLFTGAQGAPDEAHFCTWYDLAADYDALLRRIRALDDARKVAAEAVAGAAAGPRSAAVDIGPAQIEQIERAISQADLANILRRQDVCALIPGMRPEKIYHELYFSMYYLAQTLLPGHNITADDFLFRYLTRALDHRMLTLMIRRDMLPMLKGAALNLNVRSVSSPEFMEFDKSTNVQDRGSLAIELPAIEVVNDPGEYLLARDFLKERGYKVIIDGVHPLNLPLVDRAWLGFDFVKLAYTPSLAGEVNGQRGAALKSAVARIGRERIVLCRLDDEAGLKAGAELGITLYQGRLIDAMASSAKAGPATR
jgi:hypothetical protein